ncbi:unnamed protein product [Alopecurus aequalis]
MAAPAAAVPAAGKRKRDFSEDDVYLILHKYTPATILTALQEVAQHAERRRIDWRALVAKTTTGITSAREYQMLWRYFAYRHDFVENVDDSSQPLGDESDLECEIEPFPTPSSEAVAEASGFAKLGQGHRLTNGTGPVSNSKQASHTGLSPDPFDGNGPHKKKKKPKPWSKEEDADLMTGVHKCGEGNWLEILHKYSFDSTRTAVQLSQRWALICKRQGTTKPANAKPVTANFDIKATQKAFSMALDMPMGRPGLSALRSGISQKSTQHHAPVFGTATHELKSATSSPSFPLPVPVPVAVPVPVQVQVQMPLPQVQQAAAHAAPLRANTSTKSRNNSKKQAAQANLTNAPSSIQAAAIAAGGRIATPSVATDLLKAAQSTKAVHIRSRGTGASKTSTSSKSSTMAGESGTQLGSAQHPELSNCSARTPSPPVLITQATEQVNVVPEIAGVNPPEQSASAHLLETDRTLSTTPLSGPCDSIEIDDDSTFCVVTMEDLFPEDVKQPDIVDPKAEETIDPKAEDIDPKDADMLEFDRFVAQGCLKMDYLDKSKSVKIAPGAQGAIASQKKQPKQLPTVGKSIPVFARPPASVKRTKTLGSHGATFPQAITSSGLVGTGNAGVLSKALGGQPTCTGTTGKQNRCQEIMAQKQHAMNLKSNGMAKNVAPGSGTPARNAAPIAGTPARNAASGAGAPVRNAAPGTAILAKNTAPGAGVPARNAAPGTGTLAKNTAPATGPPAKNVASGTGPQAHRQYSLVANNGASKGNPPASK